MHAPLTPPHHPSSWELQLELGHPLPSTSPPASKRVANTRLVYRSRPYRIMSKRGRKHLSDVFSPANAPSNDANVAGSLRVWSGNRPSRSAQQAEATAARVAEARREADAAAVPDEAEGGGDKTSGRRRCQKGRPSRGASAPSPDPSMAQPRDPTLAAWGDLTAPAVPHDPQHYAATVTTESSLQAPQPGECDHAAKCD